MNKTELQKTACRVRQLAIDGVYSAGSGHPGGSLSVADIVTYLYCNEMKIDPKNPADPNRDRFVLSKGHCAPAMYAMLAILGYFDESELLKLRKYGEMLQGHPDMKHTPGVDMTTGSLGQGISAACGMAKAAKLSGKSYRVYAVLGDGEIEEGQVWEAAMFAAHNKLDNLCAVVDNNNLQINGEIGKGCSPYPIAEKFEAFGFNVLEIDGHNFDEIEAAFNKAKATKGKPTAIIAKTVKGKGVSFMENNPGWHGKAPSKEEYETATKDLAAIMSRL